MHDAGATGDLQTALQHAAALLRSDPGLAAEQARAILTVFPGEPSAGILLAAAERRSGRPDVAVDVVSAVVDAHPAHAVALEELGLSLLAAGRWSDAERALARAVAIDERLPAAWVALADIRTERGDGPGSGEALRRHVELSTGTIDLVKAVDALQSGDLAAAESLCRDYLRRNPRNVAAIRLLAEIGMQLGRLDDAGELLAWCLELAPDFHLARHSYAHLLLRKLRYREAVAEIDRALEAEPNRPSHLSLKAVILAQSGELEGAIEIYDAALRLDPGQPRMYLNKGNALKTIGRHDDAVAAYRHSLNLQPALGEAYWSLSNLKTFEFDDADVSDMREQLRRAAPAGQDYIHLSFALGKALEDDGEFDESFRHYANGNAARRANVHWDADEHHAAIERIASFFTPGFFESRISSGSAAPVPIFVVGLPRAGSTLIEQILASHSRVEGTLELPDIMAITGRLGREGRSGSSPGYPEVLATLTPGELESLGAEYLERTAIHRSGAPYFIDKMPNNFPHIGFIRLILPHARIIDARRQPMACCFSVFKQLFAHGQAFSYSLAEIGRYYRDYVELMAHWDAVLPEAVHRVDYESVVLDTEAVVRKLLAFCGLEFEPACLEFHRTERAVRTASSEQVRQPIYRSAVEQWRNYERHLGSLVETLGPALHEPASRTTQSKPGAAMSPVDRR